jgi:thioesterase-3
VEEKSMVQTELKLLVESPKGHVNNVRYVEYLEMGRRDWYRYCISLNVEAVVVHVSIDYKKEVFHGDQLLVISWLDRVGESSLVIKQTITNQSGELVIQAEVVLCTINRDTREKVRVPDELRNSIKVNL